jgi:hypothetical protein
MTCRSAGVTVESLRRIAKERVRLKARVGDIRAGNIAISAPRDARTEDGARLSKFPYGLDAPLPPPPSAQNLGQVQRDEEGFGHGHGQQKTPTGGTSRLGGLGLPNNRHAVVGDNASDVHPLYRGSLENQREGHSLSNRAHPHTNVNIHKVTPGRRSPNPAGHGYEYAYPDDKNFLHDWHPNLSPLHEDPQLPSHQQVHEDRITSSHSQPQPRAISPAEITEHRDLIERLHRFGIASSSSPTPSSTSQKPVQKPLPASLENLRPEEGPAEKRTDPETPRTAVFSLRRREAERIAQARYMRSFSPTERSDQGGTGHSGDEGVRGEGGLGTRKLRHRSSDTDLTGSLYSRFSRHRRGPIQRDLGRDLRDRREWKWEWELDEDRNVDFDRNHDLEEGEVVLPRVEEDGSLSDPRPDGPFPPRRASLGFGFESVGLDGRPVPGPPSSPSPWSLRREKEKLRRVAEEKEGGQEGGEEECWATRTLRKKRGKGDFKNEGGAAGGVRGEKGDEEDGLEEYLALVGKDTEYEGQRVEQKKNNNVNNRIPLTLPDGSDTAPTSAAIDPYRPAGIDTTTSDADTKSLAAFTHPSIAPQPLVVRKIPSIPRTIHVPHAIEHRSPLSPLYDSTRSYEGLGERRTRSPEMMMNGSATFTSDFDVGQGQGGPDFLLDPTWGVCATAAHHADRNRDVSPESATERHSADDLVEGLAGLGVRVERTVNGLLTSRSGDEHDVSPTSNYSDGSSSSLGLPMQSPGTPPDVDQGPAEDRYGDDGGDDYHAFMRDIHSPSTFLPPRLPRTRYGDTPVSASTNSPASRLRQDCYTSEGRPITALKGTPPYPQPMPPPQPSPQAQQLQFQIPPFSSTPLGYRIDPTTGMETEDTLGRGSLAQSTWEADLLSSYTTSTSAPPVPSVPPAVPPHSPTIFPHERGPAPAPMVCTNEHTHIMPGPSPGALRRVAGENSRVKGDNAEKQKVRLGLMTGTVEEGGRGWV